MSNEDIQFTIAMHVRIMAQMPFLHLLQNTHLYSKDHLDNYGFQKYSDKTTDVKGTTLYAESNNPLLC